MNDQTINLSLNQNYYKVCMKFHCCWGGLQYVALPLWRAQNFSFLLFLLRQFLGIIPEHNFQVRQNTKCNTGYWKDLSLLHLVWVPAGTCIDTCSFHTALSKGFFQLFVNDKKLSLSLRKIISYWIDRENYGLSVD